MLAGGAGLVGVVGAVWVGGGFGGVVGACALACDGPGGLWDGAVGVVAAGEALGGEACASHGGDEDESQAGDDDDEQDEGEDGGVEDEAGVRVRAFLRRRWGVVGLLCGGDRGGRRCLGGCVCEYGGLSRVGIVGLGHIVAMIMGGGGMAGFGQGLFGEDSRCSGVVVRMIVGWPILLGSGGFVVGGGSVWAWVWGVRLAAGGSVERRGGDAECWGGRETVGWWVSFSGRCGSFSLGRGFGCGCGGSGGGAGCRGFVCRGRVFARCGRGPRDG